MANAPRPLTERDLRRAKPLMKAMSRANVWLFRATGGRLGARFPGGAPIGLLTTRGRRSGARRTLPLLYLRDGERIVLVASQGGMPRDPVWFANLEADPGATFQVAREAPRRFRARRASAEEKARYWPHLTAMYPDYAVYQSRTERDIPVVVLEPEA